MDLIDIYRTFHPKATEYTFFSSAHDHILGYKSNLGNFKKIEIISSIFFKHKGMRLEVTYRKKTYQKHKLVKAKQYATKQPMDH